MGDDFAIDEFVASGVLERTLLGGQELVGGEVGQDAGDVRHAYYPSSQ